MADLLVVGDCNPDLLLVGGDPVPEFGQREQLVDRAVLTIGGSASITACGAARLGLATVLVASVGSDHFGSHVLEQVSARGVDVSRCSRSERDPTGITVILARGDDRAILTSIGAIAALTVADVDPDLLRSARHLHIASYFLLDGLRPGLPDLVAAAHAAGLSVSLDPQDDPAGSWDSGLPELVPHLDVLFVNERESAAVDAAGCPVVVVKRGPRGALVRTPEGVAEHPGVPVAMVDATGAGDSFDAGFLAAWLAGEPPAAALALACACGALSTRSPGGTDAQPTLEEARAALR
ncbi:MAG: carbohydrate kinase family protein [Gaiellales bacterium]